MKFLFLRILLPLLIFLVVRSVIKALFAGKGVPAKSSDGPPPVAASGELKKDPVCGTYVSAVASVSQKVGRETVYFCSDQCKQKYRA